jgi:hypothetical protein
MYRVAVPRDIPWEPVRAQHLMEQLLHAFPRLIFQIAADRDQIHWRLVDPVVYSPQALRRAIFASYPSATLQLSARMRGPLGQAYHRLMLAYAQQAETFLAPLAYVTEMGQSDPLASLVQTMAYLRPGEQVIYSLIVDGRAEDAYRVGEAQLQRKVFDGLWSLLFPRTVPRYEAPIQRVLESKWHAPLYRCVLLIQIDCPDPARFADLAVIDGQLVLFDRPGFNSLRRVQETPRVIAITLDVHDQASDTLALYERLTRSDERSPDIIALRQQAGLVLEPRELAALWHLPHTDTTAPGVVWSSKAPVPMSAELTQETTGLVLGTAFFREERRTAVLPDAARTAHLSVIGKTRTGKSNLLHHLIHQDIAAGRGVAVIDPHGDLVRHILQASIPASREADVVVLDIADTDHPPPLNLLATAQGDRSLTTASAVAGLLTSLYGDLADVPRVRSTLASVLATLWQDEQPTLLDVERLFSDAEYRTRLLKPLGVEHLRILQFWQHFEAQSQAMREQLSAPVLYRMQALYGNPALLPMTCHPDALALGSLVEQGKIILVSLAVADEVIPKLDQDLLGALLVAAIQRSAQNRRGRVLFGLYIDEAQRFVTTALPQLFAEVGKRNISVTLANQYFKQLSGDTLDAVMGNVGSLVAFRVGHEDARSLAPYFKPAFSADDLIQLDNYQAAAWIGQSAFSLTPPPPLVIKRDEALEREQRLREHSRQRYGPKSRAEILAWLETRYLARHTTNVPDLDLRYDPDD